MASKSARVSARRAHLRDFKLQIDSQDASRHHHEEVGRKQSAATGALSQSEHDWAYAKRALARGDEPELIIQRIADYRSEDKADPNYYARHTVNKAQAELQSRAPIGRPTESNSVVTNESSQEK